MKHITKAVFVSGRSLRSLNARCAGLAVPPAREKHPSRPPRGPSRSWGGPANDLRACDEHRFDDSARLDAVWNREPV
jgi:hypothetical protein